ncbi:MAG: hypothetical protein JWP97_1658 [Labilithrix sp.]|nr:hypothetical protein [Labilithrix sp.]
MTDSRPSLPGSVKGPAAREAQANVPNVTALRLVGPGADHARGRALAPFGARFTDDAEGCAVALGTDDAIDVASVARALPARDALPPGAIVVVLADVHEKPSFGGRLRSALGRAPRVPRALRASALVACGFVGVSAATDPATRGDVVWGYAPA